MDLERNADGSDLTAAPDSEASNAFQASRRSLVKAAVAGAIGGIGAGARPVSDAVAAQSGNDGPPNIVMILADDVGYWNVSAYNQGMMGYRTPNIDRIAREGTLFTDAYAEQSCTAGRAAFITGQSPLRTGLLTIGIPGAPRGLHADDPTLAELLKTSGYATGQFGKNHLGDLNSHLPTVHGFDEFYGNLYHLNAHEEPENPDYPDDPLFAAQFGPRGVLHSFASDEDDPTVDPRFGPVGRQVIEDTGPLDTERMKTVDQEFLAGALDFVDRAHAADQPFFLWFCPSRMHIFTHLTDEAEGATGLGVVADGMVEHDGHVGQVLQKLDDLGIAENTIVIYAADNGAQIFSWPDGTMAPFKSEKNSNWEGGFRIPMLVRWPSAIEAGTYFNDIFSLQDWLPTLMSAVGSPEIPQDLLEGVEIGGRTVRAHIDGYDQLSALTDGAPGARQEFFYFSEQGDLVGVRSGRWKFVLMKQEAVSMQVWFEPYDELRGPRIIDLRGDPFERAPEEAGEYDNWMLDRLFLIYPLRGLIGQFMATFEEFPTRTYEQMPA